jgi:hypothetical protein
LGANPRRISDRLWLENEITENQLK